VWWNPAVRLAIDTGGTFTDLVVSTHDGRRRLFKSATTPDDPIEGVFDVLGVAADSFESTPAELLANADLLIYATTRALNAVLTGTVAKTAFLTTEGHPEILLFREGGRTEPFNHRRSYPPPYVPRHLTWQVPERVNAQGEIVQPLDEAAASGMIDELEAAGVQAVGVCLLWSIANPAHELRLGELLEQRLPGIPVTLSHELNPTIREYRRASATVIDASLKPVMAEHLSELQGRLSAAGLRVPVVVVTSSGGVMESSAVAAAPIHMIASGPAMAPIAGRHYASVDTGSETAIVTDTGGTSYDVSLVRGGRIPRTRETWLGERFLGHMTGFPSVDVRSIGAGGGSIAWVDEGGFLHVGPQSAGANPGPACYGRGGDKATLTDAAVVLGYLDPATFLGGAMPIDAGAARRAIERFVASPLELDPREAAAAVLEVTTEQMVHAIEEITVNQGIDPREAVLVGGGGAAGFNAVAVARRLGSSAVLFPPVAAGLSAAGALASDLVAEFASIAPTSSATFSFAEVNRVLDDLLAKSNSFLRSAMSSSGNAGAESGAVEYWVEARYTNQVWELELPVDVGRFAGPDDVERLTNGFHDLHERVFEVRDVESPVEFIAWRARANLALRNGSALEQAVVDEGVPATSRPAHFPGIGETDVRVQPLSGLEPGAVLAGPVIVEADLMTIVVPPGASIGRSTSGGALVDPWVPA
jgi:N-methylhydantoinase A